MKFLSNITRQISIPLIVANVCLFQVNTAIAVQRPYIPSTDKWPGVTAPLSTIVAKIQREQQEDNTVMWVDYNSPHFSNAGLAVNSTTINNHSIFNGLQDMDQPTDYVYTPSAKVAVTRNKKKVVATKNNHKPQSHQVNMRSTGNVVIAKNSNNLTVGASVFRNLDDAEIEQNLLATELEQEQNFKQVAQLLPKNVWLDLDS